MNWKQALNPWGYARGLEIALDTETDNAKSWRKKYDEATVKANEYRLKNQKLNGDIAQSMMNVGDCHQRIDALKAELATALDALRIADERANRNEAALRASSKIAKIKAVSKNPAIAGVTPKLGAIPKRTATAPGGARLVLKDSGKPNDGADAAYAKHVKDV